MEPASPSTATSSASASDFFLEPIPELDRAAPARHGQGLAAAAAAVRVLRRLRRLRRDAVPEAAHAAVRRPDDRRQRHRLLVDLRRQPADDPVDDRTPTGAARPGRTRCSRTTPSSGSGIRLGARPAAVAARAAAPARRRARRRPRRSRAARAPTGPTRRGIAAQRERVAELRRAPAGSSTADAPRALARPRRRRSCAARVDRRRRRLGLRHRLRRPRPRAGVGPQRQRPGARHRGVLQHRRAGVEGDAPRRGREVRHRRQGARRRRTSGARPRCSTATSTSPRSRWAPTTCRPSRRCARPRPGRGRRW
jgi:hypothetical protein